MEFIARSSKQDFKTTNFTGGEAECREVFGEIQFSIRPAVPLATPQLLVPQIAPVEDQVAAIPPELHWWR